MYLLTIISQAITNYFVLNLKTRLLNWFRCVLSGASY